MNSRILTASNHTRAALSMLLIALVGSIAFALPGDLDTSFNGTGKRIVSFSPDSDWIEDMEVQPDGKVIAAGRGFFPGNALSSAIIARFNSDGSNDATFGTNGVVVTNFGFAGAAVWSITLQPDGRILASAAGYPSVSANQRSIVARFLADGAPDPSFHYDGIAEPFAELISTPRSIAIQADNKIVVAGIVGGLFRPGDLFVLRYTPDGRLDRRFGHLGRVTISTVSGAKGEGEGIFTVKIQADQKIVLVGNNGFPSDNTTFVLRLQPHGKIDASFGNLGMQTISFGTGINLSFDFEIQGDGKIVIGGHYAATEASQAFWTLARLTSNGIFDNSFDDDGRLTIADALGRQIYSFEIAVQADGKLVMGGVVRESMAPGTANFLVMRRNSDSTPDLSFGTAGRVETDMSPTGDQVFALRIQPDGKIVAGGSADGSFALARYLAQ